jgi:hypothetical protein
MVQFHSGRIVLYEFSVARSPVLFTPEPDLGTRNSRIFPRRDHRRIGIKT